jgi:hypothetical protein
VEAIFAAERNSFADRINEQRPPTDPLSAIAPLLRVRQVATLPAAMMLNVNSERALGHMRRLVQMIDEELTSALAVASGLSSALLVLMLRVHFEQADRVVRRQVCPARSAPGGRPKRRLNARLKELSDW